MNSTDYRKLFSEHRQGYSRAIQILSDPVMPLPDPPLKEEHQALIGNLISQVKKGYSACVALAANNPTHQALLVGHFGYVLKQPLWLIDSEQLMQQETQHTGSINHLFAQAKTHQCILFFDEADSLLKPQAQQDSESGNERFISLAEQFNGLCLLGVGHPDSPLSLRIKHRVFLD